MNLIERFHSLFSRHKPALQLSDNPSEATNDVLVLCLGTSGKRIWPNLIVNRNAREVFPIMPSNNHQVQELVKLLESRRFLLVSGLNEPMLTSLMDGIEKQESNFLKVVNGIILAPKHSIAATDRTDQNLRQIQKMLKSVKVVWPPNKESKDHIQQYNLKWLPNQITHQEKLATLQVFFFAEKERVKATSL